MWNPRLPPPCLQTGLAFACTGENQPAQHTPNHCLVGHNTHPGAPASPGHPMTHHTCFCTSHYCLGSWGEPHTTPEEAPSQTQRGLLQKQPLVSPTANVSAPETRLLRSVLNLARGWGMMGTAIPSLLEAPAGCSDCCLVIAPLCPNSGLGFLLAQASVLRNWPTPSMTLGPIAASALITRLLAPPWVL